MSNKEMANELKANLNKSVSLILNEQKGLFDVDKAVKVIVSYVISHDKVEDNDASRYEKYFNLSQKANVIAEGWLKNCSQEVKHYEETEVSLTSYIEKTYGRN